MIDHNCDACESTTRADPPNIHNRPGLSAILYRARTYASFRRAMLTRIPFERVEGKMPLADWTTRQDDDFGIALIDLWAYVADVLTFYQERTANEAYLRTARRRAAVRRKTRSSMMRLTWTAISSSPWTR
jgi:hypothetical protein